MGVFSKTTGLLKSPLSDEVVRTVDADRSELPTWEPEEDQEPQTPKKKPQSKSKAPKKKKPVQAASSPKPKKKRAIDQFETWEDEDFTEDPREVTIDRQDEDSVQEPESIVLDESGYGLDIDDDSDDEFEELTSLDDNPRPHEPESITSESSPQDLENTVESFYPEDDSEVDKPSENEASPFELQSTVLEHNENNTLDDDPQTEESEPKMTSQNIELPDVTPATSEELIREHSEAPLDLSRAISLDSLDNIVFPNETEGYNRANVDTMMSFLRLSLSLYIRQNERLERTISNLAEELEERTNQYVKARDAVEASVSPLEHDATLEENERLERTVRDLASRLNLDVDSLLEPDTSDDDALVFGRVSTDDTNQVESPSPQEDVDDTQSEANKDADVSDEEDEDELQFWALKSS